MPIPFEPWLSYPPLTLENLKFVAALMRDVRDGAVLLHDVEAGDSNWGLGCRIYDRIIGRIRRASITTPWLTVLPESQTLRLTFAIGSLPLKIYRGDADEVPGKFLVRSFAELDQMELAFAIHGVDSTNLLRIAVEPDASGKTSAVTLVEVEKSGNPLRIFQIPLDTAKVIEMKPKPITLDPPKLEAIGDSAEEEESAGAEGKAGTSNSES
jgi:hypothetical protein